MQYTFDDLLELFGAERLDAAAGYIEQGRVAHPDVRQDGRLITSLIRTPGSRPHRVYIRIDVQSDSAEILGECSCPEPGNCEHVAAVLLRALEESEGLPESPAREPLLADSPPKPTVQDAEYPDSVRQRLLYLLFPAAPLASGVEMQTVSARLLPSGEFGRFQEYQPEWVMRGRPPRFLLETDCRLLAELDRLPVEIWSNARHLDGRTGARLLSQMLETGRCYLGETEKVLREGELRDTRFAWEIDAAGRQYPRFEGGSPTLLLFVLDQLWYLDTDSGSCGRMRSGLPEPLLRALSELADGVAPEDVPALNRRLSKLAGGVRLPPLRELQVEVLGAVSPQPCLRLTSQVEQAPWGEEWLDLAQLSFDYAGRRCRLHQPSQWLEGNRLVRIRRDERIEQAAAELLMQWGFEWNDFLDVDPGSFVLADEPEAWFEFQLERLPRLREAGWRIEFAEAFRWRLLEVDNWYGKLEPGAGSDAFRLDLGVAVEGEQINLLPALVELLNSHTKLLDPRQLHRLGPEQVVIVGLDERRSLPLPLGRVRPILETLFELYQHDSLDETGRLPLSRIQLTRLAELGAADATLRIEEGETEALNLMQRLRGIDQLPAVTPPQGLQARLRDYQLQGLAWLQFLRENRLGGVLADDMGLGKTVQTLAHLLLEKEQGRLDRPALVVAPTSLLVNWRREARQFAPALRVLILHGPKRRTLQAGIPEHDLVLTSYPLLARDREALLEQQFHLLILDEAQAIKNPKTQASRVVRELDARHRLCLTGTPLENHLGELWAQFDFLLPGLLGNQKQFRRVLRNPIEKQGDEDVAQRLALRLRPFMLRRTKQEVARELPPKTEILRTVELEGAQRELYESIRLTLQEQVRKAVEERGWERSRIMVLDALLKLRQVCCDPRLVKLADARKVGHSAKLELLMEMLPELIEEGRRVLLFSQFTGMLGLIEEAVQQAGIDYVKLTGRTRDRAKPVDRFQNGEVPLFLISLKAGGTGLNLTAADTVIHYDPWWNPAVERQATDRAHRIGQRNPVFVYKLITEGTVEEKIQQMQSQKQALADSLFEKAAAAASGWSEAEIEKLFGPLE